MRPIAQVPSSAWTVQIVAAVYVLPSLLLCLCVGLRGALFVIYVPVFCAVPADTDRWVQDADKVLGVRCLVFSNTFTVYCVTVRVSNTFRVLRDRAR
jgi:hypothetical protein